MCDAFSVVGWWLSLVEMIPLPCVTTANIIHAYFLTFSHSYFLTLLKYIYLAYKA